MSRHPVGGWTPDAQGLIQRDGICSCYYRLPNGQRALCMEKASDFHWHGSAPVNDDPARQILGDYEWRRNNLHLPLEQQSSEERAFRAGVLQAITNPALAAAFDAHLLLSVTATNDASTASPIATDTPSAPLTNREDAEL